MIAERCGRPGAFQAADEGLIPDTRSNPALR